MCKDVISTAHCRQSIMTKDVEISAAADSNPNPNHQTITYAWVQFVDADVLIKVPPEQ